MNSKGEQSPDNVSILRQILLISGAITRLRVVEIGLPPLCAAGRYDGFRMNFLRGARTAGMREHSRGSRDRSYGHSRSRRCAASDGNGDIAPSRAPLRPTASPFAAIFVMIVRSRYGSSSRYNFLEKISIHLRNASPGKHGRPFNASVSSVIGGTPRR
jgi:hypothetical protein